MSHLVMKLAIALLPPSRKAWGKAMAAEFAHMSDGQSGFAFGCFRASVRENVTTSEGLARIGFAMVLILSLWLTAFWISNAFITFADRSQKIGPTLLWELAVQGFTLIPLVFGFAAYQAMRQPTNKHHLAQVGHKAATACLIFFGVLHMIMNALTAVIILEFKEKGQTIETSLFIGLAFGIVFLSVAWSGRRSALLMRNAGTIALLLSLACAGLSAVQNAAQPEASGHNYAFSAIWMSFFMLLTAIGGALFMWMQRPSSPAH